VVQFCGKQNAQITFRAQTSQHQRCRILNDKFRQMQICLLCNHPKNQYQSGTTFMTAQFWHLAALNVNNYTFYQFPCHRWHLVIDTSESYRWNSSVKIWTGAGWYSTANGKQVPCTIKSTTGLLSSTGYGSLSISGTFSVFLNFSETKTCLVQLLLICMLLKAVT